MTVGFSVVKIDAYDLAMFIACYNHMHFHHYEPVLMHIYHESLARYQVLGLFLHSFNFYMFSTLFSLSSLYQ